MLWFLLRQATFDTNVMGPIRLTRLIAPSMIKRGGGNIVLVCPLFSI